MNSLWCTNCCVLYECRIGMGFNNSCNGRNGKIEVKIDATCDIVNKMKDFKKEAANVSSSLIPCHPVKTISSLPISSSLGAKIHKGRWKTIIFPIRSPNKNQDYRQKGFIWNLLHMGVREPDNQGTFKVWWNCRTRLQNLSVNLFMSPGRSKSNVNPVVSWPTR